MNRTKSRYEGEYRDGWFDGKGTFYFNDHHYYVGEFVKGEFHGEGTLVFPTGSYKGTWNRGKLVKGQYVFNDTLKYQFDDWKFCVPENRSFYDELEKGINAAGSTQMTSRTAGPNEIPEGTYDVGEGYYQPIKSIIYKCNGDILRTPSEEEVKNIVAKCRYNPRSIDIGKDDFVIRKMMEKNREQDKKAGGSSSV